VSDWVWITITVNVISELLSSITINEWYNHRWLPDFWLRLRVSNHYHLKLNFGRKSKLTKSKDKGFSTDVACWLVCGCDIPWHQVTFSFTVTPTDRVEWLVTAVWIRALTSVALTYEVSEWPWPIVNVIIEWYSIHTWYSELHLFSITSDLVLHDSTI